MEQKKSKRVYLLLLSAFIWGTAFVAQLQGGFAVGPYSFVLIRSIIGSLVLLPVIRFLDRKGLSANRPLTKEEWRVHLKGGFWIGLLIFLTSVFQQLGMYLGTTAGKSGFLTSCYIIFVPIFGLFLGKRCAKLTWLAVGMALVGLYLLCITGAFTVQKGDMIVFLAAACCAGQILTVDRYSGKVDAIRMSAIEFAIGAVLSVIPTLIFEMHPWDGGMGPWLSNLTTLSAWLPLLYAGVLSNGVAYTLQVVAQKDANPTVASILMSLESVFSVLAGAVILAERLSVREGIGCIIIFAAVLLAQRE